MAVPANAQEIFNGLVKGGLTPVAASAVLGNIQNESGGDYNSGNLQAGGLIGFTQPVPPGLPPGWKPGSPPAAQIAAVVWWVQNEYPGGVSALNKINDPNAAGQSFARLGERCLQCGSTPGASTAQLGPRGQNAVDVYNAYKSGSLGHPTQGATTGTTADSSGCVHTPGTCNPCNGINLDPASSLPIVGGIFPTTNLFNGCQIKALVGGLLIGGGGFIMLAGTVLIAAYGLGHTGAGRTITAATGGIPGVGRATAGAARVGRGQAPVRRSAKRSAPRRASSGQRPVRVPANQRAGAVGAKTGGKAVNQGVDLYDKGYTEGVASVSGIDQSKRVRASDITSEGGNRTASGSTSKGTKRSESPRKAA